MTEIYANPDGRIWLPAPSPDQAAPGSPELQAWAADMSAQVWAVTPRAPDENGRARLSALLAAMGSQTCPSDDVWHQKWIHLPDADDLPLAVVASLFDADGLDPEELRAMVGEGDPTTVEPAIVEPFTGKLGNGYRGLKYRAIRETGGEVFATLAYSWWVPQMGAEFRIWTTWYPQRILAAMDHVDDLARSCEVVDS